MTEILIYGIVGDSWDGLDANTLVPMISAGDDDLDVRLNTPGGYVMEGLAIFNALVRERKKGRRVTTHIDGLAASMGSVIAMAGADIVMADNALMMIHNPWDCACGDAAELRRAADQLDRIRDQLVGIYAARTGLDTAALVPMLDAETWLTAAECLAQKFVTAIAPAGTAEASNISAFGFRRAPDSPLLTTRAMARRSRTAAAAPPHRQETNMPQPAQPAASTQAATTTIEGQATTTVQPVGTTTASGPTTETSAAALTAVDVQNAVSAERSRVAGIRALGRKHRIAAEFVDGLVDGDTSLAAAREQILDRLAEAGDAANVGHSGPIRITADAQDKWREGATNWILVKAGVANLIEKAARARGETIRIDPGEFRGVRNSELARESLLNLGLNVTTRDPDLLVRQAITSRAVVTQTTSDFPVLFENAVHRILQASYTITPDTWSRFCGTGTVTDFRDHTRYLRGSFGALDNLNEAGEFKNKPIPDLAKERIRATTKGNIINLSRQAIVNDDMEVFSGLAVDLGRAAKLTIEIDVYALLNSNPLMNDGLPLFHASHGNLAAAGAAPSVAAFDAMRVAMASQKDISGNEYLEIRPSVGLFPLSLGSVAKILNASQYDPDAVNKLQRPNVVAGLFADIVDTPRLSGTPYYGFADPDVAPALEVVFLNGVTEPFTDSEDGWRTDGVEWKVRHDYGVGAVNFRSAYKQPGAAN
jgi:ATP-dependent protease ClpP protease subunit